MQNRRAINFRGHFGLTLLFGSLLAFSSAYADTYNFFFTKPGKKGAKTENSEPATNSSPQSSADDDDASERSVSEDKPAPATPTTPETPVENKTSSANSSTAPIVIHNNINNAPSPPTSLPAAPDQSELKSKGSSVASEDTDYKPFDPPVRRPYSHPFKIAVSLQTFEYTPVEWSGSYSGRSPEKQALGISIGYAFNKNIHWMLYGSTSGLFDHEELGFYGGSDLEIYPLSLGNGRHEIFQLGFLLGGSTAAGSRDSLGTLHAGARMNVQFNDNFAVTVASRVNLGHAMAEAGVVTRF